MSTAVFDPTTVSSAACCTPFDVLREMRWVVDGRHPLDGWRHLREGNCSLLRKSGMPLDRTTVVVLVPGDGGLFVTTYWDADAREVLKVHRRQPHNVFRTGVTWDGPLFMTEQAAFRYIATGVE